MKCQKNNSFNTINSSVSNDYIFANPKTKKPYVMLKTATTLDAKIATSTKKSKWITSNKKIMEEVRMKKIKYGVNTKAEEILRILEEE